MKFRNLLVFFFLILIVLQGCSSKNSRKAYSYKQDKSFPIKANYNYQIKDSLTYNQLYKALNMQYNDWKGVKYKFGGNTKKGVDCSAFVQRTFKDRLNITIPRTTALQSKFGEDVSMNNLEMGDLIFFKTGYKTRHVGIYLEGGKFLHASTKRGVTISRLDNSYYSKHFWKIKRVIQ